MSTQAKHPMAGTILTLGTLGTHVYRYNDVGGTVLVAACTSPEAAQAAARLMAM